MKTVLIIGMRGMVGSALHCRLIAEKQFTVIGTTSSKDDRGALLYLNLEEERSVETFSVDRPIDHVIITSGYEPHVNLADTSAHHVRKMFAIHLTGPILLLKGIHKFLNPGGSVIFISSPAAYKGSYDPAYAAVKAGVNGLVKTLAKDFAPAIRVNALSPSLIKDSPVYERMTEDFRQKHLNLTLTKKHTTADECVDSILFLMHSQQTTGQILHLNGGMVFGN
jgi:3-oxoacyl-[acyl-carrier protein] reductase